ncbi:helix-turn-helix domain-containing protein [Georgenia thermotolerans]|uniref:Helix-turn-helix domain-containing protein n=1 Tax=Georgenia thermotolerans TaxID=527326 RepID=A0A7J5UUH4_9MICO|nr:helix-turn-helix domain-containing protein [Georgenia thermotolerans]KAE8765927.1 helix-turn-helix domain-containing protein [Georgenia thermotolerans]
MPMAALTAELSRSSATTTSDSRAARPASRRLDRLDIIQLGTGSWHFPASLPTHRRYVLAAYVLRGALRVGHGDHGLSLSQGQFTTVWSGTAARLEVGDSAEVLLVRIPEVMAGEYAPAFRAVDCRPVDADRGTAGLVGHLLRGLAADAGELHPENPVRLAQHIVGLLALLCADETRAAPLDERAAALRAAKEYIEENLNYPELTSDRVARAQNMSTRTLHRLFEAEGLTIAGWIRARRLEHCRAELVDPQMRTIPVSGIGSRWGLWDPAHFSRLFKAAFGVSPRAYRTKHLGHRCDEACRPAMAAGV